MSSRSEEVLNEKYPHYKTYKSCQQRAFLSGSLTLLGVGVCTYLLMGNLFKRYKVNVNKNWLVAGPMITGAVVAYAVTMSRSISCQDMWMAMEERHSVLTSAEERLAERKSDS